MSISHRVTFDFAGAAPDATTVAPPAAPQGLALSSWTAHGDGGQVFTVAYPNAPVWRMVTAAGGDVDKTRYSTVTVTATEAVKLTALTLRAAKGGSGGERRLAVAWSVDNFATFLTDTLITSVRPAMQDVTVSVPDVVIPAGQRVELRFHVATTYGSSVEVDDVAFTVNSAQVASEPDPDPKPDPQPTPQPAASLKLIEDATSTVNAASPSPESALTPVLADKATDNTARIQTALDYVKATYGAGVVQLPPGTMNCNGGLTIPRGVQLAGRVNSVLDFWFAPDGITAITIEESDAAPLRHLKINANQWDANTPRANTTTKTGIKITGAGLRFDDVRIHGFNVGVDVTADNTFIINFTGGSITGCKIGLNADLANAWSGRARSSQNSGERITFTDFVFANCGTAFYATGDGLDLHLTHTSVDYCNVWGRINGAHVFCVSSHFEGVHNGEAGASSRPYMFDLTANPRLTFAACSFILGGSAFTHIVNPGSGPWNYGAGQVKFTGCDMYNTGAPGATRLGNSDALVGMAAGTTTLLLSSACVSKYSRARVHVVCTDGLPQADLTARITALDTVAGTLTVTLSAPAPTGTFIEVSF